MWALPACLSTLLLGSFHAPSLSHPAHQSLPFFPQVKQFLDLIPQCVYIGFYTLASNSQTTPGYLRIQLNSDDVYQKIASVSTGEGLSHIRSPSTYNVSCKTKLLHVLLTSWLHNVGSSYPLQLGMPIISPGWHLYF